MKRSGDTGKFATWIADVLRSGIHPMQSFGRFLQPTLLTEFEKIRRLRLPIAQRRLTETARMMIAPLMISWMVVENPMTSRPKPMMPMKIAPTTEPRMVP